MGKRPLSRKEQEEQRKKEEEEAAAHVSFSLQIVEFFHSMFKYYRHLKSLWKLLKNPRQLFPKYGLRLVHMMLVLGVSIRNRLNVGYEAKWKFFFRGRL